MSERDLEALEEAYERALAHEKAGRLDEAERAYREVLALDPADCAGAAVRLAAMGRGDTPVKAPDAYVSTLFDQHADMFEAILVDQLGYRVPDLMREALDAQGLGSFGRVLDLGCGSGLAGEAMYGAFTHLTGVDLSENMVAVAGEGGLYDELFVGEAVRFLDSWEGPGWDLIAATDVLPYMGALEAFFALAARRLEPGGVFAFSSETLPPGLMAGRSYMVGPHQRFAHAEAYIRGLLEANGLRAWVFVPITVRHEEGQPVPGHLVIAVKG
ncbi:MAG: methyltransferase domain-containing protein [Flavobacteriaceae bacterium]